MNNFTTSDGNIFCLHNLPEEVIAAAFARYSRSKGGLRDILSEMLGEGWETQDETPTVESQSAQEFHRKWVTGFGHRSVAEHAIAHIAVEGCSSLAALAIEDNRLASYTEKSTRYTTIGPKSFYTDPLISADPVCADMYQQTCSQLLHTYSLVVRTLCTHWIDGLKPTAMNTVHRHALDVARSLLPCSVQTNLGVTVNARELDHMAGKLLGSSLYEFREVGKGMLIESRKVLPSLLDHVQPIPEQPQYPISGFRERTLLKGVSISKDFSAWHLMRNAPSSIDDRQAELFPVHFEIIVDNGAYRDIHRHRIGTQIANVLDTSLGFDVPVEVDEIGLGSVYKIAMEKACETSELIKSRLGARLAQYVIPFAYKRLINWYTNVRELGYFIKLRSGKAGHPVYRKLARQMATIACQWYPSLKPLIECDKSSCEDWRKGLKDA